MHDTDNRRIQGEHNITIKVGVPWNFGTGRIVVVDLVEVYGSIPVGVGTFYGYQCPMCVGVFVLGASEESDSDVNIWTGFSKVRTLRVHIHWMKGVGVMRCSGEEPDSRMTHGTGGHNRRLRG